MRKINCIRCRAIITVQKETTIKCCKLEYTENKDGFIIVQDKISKVNSATSIK